MEYFCTHNRKVKKVMWDLIILIISISPIDGEQAGKTVSIIIAGSFLGALAVILLILLTAVGTAFFIKKGIQNYFQSRSSAVLKCVSAI